MTQKELIVAEIERLKGQLLRGACASQIAMETRCKDEAYNEILNFINSLPEEPRFKVGDMVISTKNPSLTYKVLQVGLPNELGQLDYEVEIFTEGKAGIKVGKTFHHEHNIHLISCNKIDEWGKLVKETTDLTD